MKAFLVDDEPLACYELRRLLRAHPEVEIVGEAEDGEQALRLLATVTPDVLFLDIQMPGLSGFDLLDRLGGNVPDVIFTTAYEQHALRAFEVNALDYLLKPIAPDRLAEALRRLGHRRPLAPASQIFVRDGDRCWIVPLADIYLLESEGNYTRLCFGAERPLLRRSLNALERQLAPQTFFRANRRQILNLQAIAKTQLTETGRLAVTLQAGPRVELSRRQSELLRAKLSP